MKLQGVLPMRKEIFLELLGTASYHIYGFNKSYILSSFSIKIWVVISDKDLLLLFDKFLIRVGYIK